MLSVRIQAMMRSMKCFDLKKFFLRWRMSLLAVVVAAVVVAILWCVPPWLVEQALGEPVKPVEPVEPAEIASLEDAYRRTLAQILGGLALLYGLYLTQRRIVATENNVRVAQETVRVVEEGQITERFTRAIEQLGDQEMAIRLGGIYALERIAKDSEKDHGPIMEVLTAYVREGVPRQEGDTPEEAKSPPTDIQAILTVIGRREATGNVEVDILDLDLSHTRLVKATLSEANLFIANLTGADLTAATLTRAYLEAATLTGADLTAATLTRADLEAATLTGANLTGANLTRADLTRADLTRADLTRADLDHANLDHAKNLTEKQVLSTENWHNAILPDYLRHLPHAHPASPA